MSQTGAGPDPLHRTTLAYDEVASDYLRRNGMRYPGLVDDLDGFCESLPPGATVVDLGCGPGRDVELLRARGMRVLGVDLSAGMLLAGGVPGCVRGDMRSLPIADRSADGVWCNAALLHIPRTEVPGVLGEFARVLRPGGATHLTISEGDGEGWESGTYRGCSARWFVHHRGEAFEELVRTAGFEVLSRRREVTHRAWLRLFARRG